jgi:hypothetical protein
LLEEDCQCRSEAVQEGAATYGPDLSAAEEAGHRPPAERLADHACVVVRRREHLRAAAVAGEKQRPSRARGRAAERAIEGLLEVLVCRGGVADVEAQRLADPHLLADRDCARLLVGTEDGAHQVVASAVLRLVLVDHQPDENALCSQHALGRREQLDLLTQPLERRHPCELVQDVAVRPRHDRVAADRRTPLRDRRQDGRARDDDPNRAVRMHFPVDDQRLRLRLSSARCDAAHEREPGALVVQLRQERPDRESERVGEEGDQRRPLESREAGDRDLGLGLDRSEMKALDLGARERSRPDRRGRAVLELARTRHDALGNARQEVPRAEHLAHDLRRLLGLLEVSWGEEAKGEVDRGSVELGARLRSRLTGGVGSTGLGREARADPRHELESTDSRSTGILCRASA